MDVDFKMRAVVLGLLLILFIQGPIYASAQSNKSTNGGPKQRRSSTPVAEPSVQQTLSPDIQQKPDPASSLSLTSTPAPTSTQQQTDSFSQLTLFLFGSGLALFIALLGWSDQIRGIDKDTKELEDRFLAQTKIDKQDFLNIVKPSSPDDQLVALTQVMTAGQISSNHSAELLQTFHTWNGQWTAIERLSAWKYNLTLSLTITLFVTGTISLFTNPSQRILYGLVRTETALITVPMVLVGVLLVIIICSSHREKKLRNLLESISDRV